MTTDNLEKFHQKLQAGKAALERGNYRLSIENLEAAKDYIPHNSRKGGEAQIWLVSAYQAANKIAEATTLCQELIVHPDAHTREQAQRILYIIKAPKLERPPEWMSEIPDFSNTESNNSRYVTAKKTPSKNSFDLLEENLETPVVEESDNQFIWFALFATVAIIVSFFWFN